VKGGRGLGFLDLCLDRKRNRKRKSPTLNAVSRRRHWRCTVERLKRLERLAKLVSHEM